jgi:hypothetical protein
VIRARHSSTTRPSKAVVRTRWHAHPDATTPIHDLVRSAVLLLAVAWLIVVLLPVVLDVASHVAP